jgi:hypothetical protein
MFSDEELDAKVRLRIATEKRFCKMCGEDRPLAEFYLRIRRTHGVAVREKLCKKHHNEITAKGIHTRPANAAFMRYRHSAKVRGLEFAIILEQVKEWFSKPCTYCEGTELMRTLDRVDNSRGYVPDNVVPCCIRCNLLKGDMPEAAWFMLVPNLKVIRESGAFGSWIGRNFNMRKTDTTTA